MTPLEERLRHDLPELARSLIGAARSGQQVAGTTEMVDRTTTARGSSWSGAVTIAAAVILVVGGLVVVGLVRERSADTDRGVVPIGFGVWTLMADAPIDPRPYAVSAWTGSEAVFWVGSNLSRTFAYGDGATYDPANDTWRTLEVPGPSHPGLTSAFFDGELYVLAKGSGTRFDPSLGSWTALPPVEDMYLAAAVSSDDAVWAIGPVLIDTAEQPDLAIARYEPATHSWIYGSVFKGADDQAAIVSGLPMLDSDVVWAGSEIVIWNGDAGGIAYDPRRDTWRTIANPISPDGQITDSTITMTDAGLVIVANVASGIRSSVDTATYRHGQWDWSKTDIPIERFDTVTVAAADDWIVIFSADEAPAVVHVPTGIWERDVTSPLAGLQEPNAVWTGTSLIVWGGQATPTPTIADPANGAIWTPPGE